MTEMASLVSNRRRSSHQTQWAAQFAAASELCRRSYQVALTLGNQPSVDIMVMSPNGYQFKIDVKGLYRPNYFIGDVPADVEIGKQALLTLSH